MSSNPPPPSPVNKQAMSRATTAGVILSIVAIVLFVVFWLVLGQVGLEHIPRLLLSLCVPPAIISVIAVFYFRRLYKGL
jgi:lipopolysaccharide export LptBFGC system permease protein LptF